MDRIDLSERQQQIADNIVDWLNNGDKQTYAVCGYAGTGKTTIGRWLQEEIGGASFLAYTGKAVNVLFSKGCREVSTIHSAIMEPARKDTRPLNDLRERLSNATSEFDKLSIKNQIADMEEELAKPHFKLREGKEVEPFKIVDEYSMINQDLYRDLTKSFKKILFFGDEFQLPPIGNTSNGEKAYCPVQPDEYLTEIHRQAADSPILHAATAIRNLAEPDYCNWGDFRVVHRRELTNDDLINADKVIVGYNKTRHEMNKWFRDAKGIRSILPRQGEMMMCLQNYKELGLFNGMEVEVLEDAVQHPSKPYAYLCKFKGINKNLEGEQPLECWLGELQGDVFRYSDVKLRGLRQFAFCNAITCHKSQGSEYGDLIIFDEPVADKDLSARDRAVMIARWRYTAVTRGKKRVTIVKG